MGKHYEQLTAEERAAIMMMKADNCSARQIALTLRRAPSTISRELARFAAWPDRPAAVACTPTQYDARAAGLRARRARFKCRKRSKLATDTVLFGVVQHFLAQAWSPSQIAGTLKLMWPDEPQRTVSHESIYTCIYAMPKGELRKDLIACLRRAKSKRMPRSRGEDRRGQMPDLLSIHVRPPEASDRAFPGHWEGDLIKGKANATQFAHLDFGDSKMGFMVEHRLMQKYNARNSAKFANSPNLNSPGKKYYEAADAKTQRKVNRLVTKLDNKFKKSGSCGGK